MIHYKSHSGKGLAFIGSLAKEGFIDMMCAVAVGKEWCSGCLLGSDGDVVFYIAGDE